MKPYFRNFTQGKTILLSILFLFSILFIENVTAQINSEVLTNKLNSYIDSVYVTDKVPGIAVGIYTPDFTYNYVIGKADLLTGTERKYDDLIRIGSITKTFTATVLLQLADEGKLSIDDKLSKFFPSYPNSENITIRQVLDMTSGIPDFLEDPVLLKSFYYDRTNKYTEQEIFDRTVALGPAFPPGEGWVYSNGNYNILGMIIEQITGKKVGEEITNRIITPLGLKNTYYPVDGNINGIHSHGYFSDTLTGELMDFTFIEPSITGAAGCMISNLPDLKIYCEALTKGKLISKEMEIERLKFVPTGLAPFASYGLGIFNLSGFIGHNGGITGYNSMMCYNPELDVTVVLNVNEFGASGGISDKVFMGIAKLMYPDKGLFK